MHEPIAVIGLACRYPGADDADQLWDLILSQRRMFRRIPPERLRLDDYYSPDPSTPDAIYATHAALLEDYEFDRVGYRVSGATYRSTDLVHWLALDIAGQAVEDAGLERLPGLDRDRAGIVVGNTLTGEFSRSTMMRLRWPYVRRTVGKALADTGMDGAAREEFLAALERDYKAPFPAFGEDSLAGGLSNTIAGRICNTFDYHGGGYTVDGACASSLLAVTDAVGRLVAGDLDVALAGGVDLSIDPFELIGFAKTGALAPTLMRVYDRRSEGFWPGEGCGFVVLARHSDAVEWGARIRAVIHGWGVSSDGRGGITRPEASGQMLALRRAYARAGYGPNEVELFEGHGTGTAVGDATELRALAAAGRESGDRERPAALGTIKANIGHTKAAAGVAGLIKAILSVDHGILPPTTGNEQPHAELTGPDARLRVLKEPEPWPEGTTPRAGVSAMGFGGINTHITLAGARAARRRRLTVRERLLGGTAQDHELFLLDAKNLRELGAGARTLAERADVLSFGGMRDLAIDMALKAPARPGSARAAVLAATPAEFAARMDSLADGIDHGRTERLDAADGVLLGERAGEPRIGFLFPGQASPTHRDGGALARRFAGVAGLFQDVRAMEGDATDTAIAQPAIVACSVAAAQVLADLAITGDKALGHSLGELTALQWAGALTPNELLRLAGIRGRAMADCTERSGAMAAVMAPEPVVEELIDGLDLCVAAYNAPGHLVVSGAAEDVPSLLERSRSRGVRTIPLPVSHAFHSPLMAQADKELRAELERLGPVHGDAAVVSTVTGRALDPGTDVRDLLLDQLVAPVRFTDALEELTDDIDLLIEVGPGTVLTGLADRVVSVPVVATDAGSASLRPLLTAVGTAYVLGARMDVAGLAHGRHRWNGADPRRRPAFLANPCESAPDDDGAPPMFVEPTPDQAGAAEPGGAGEPGRASGEEPEGDPTEVVRRLIARQAELPLEAVPADSSMLTDLNLSSITVGQIVADAAAELGVRPPLAAPEFATGTIAELAGVLANAEPDDGTDRDRLPAGVAGWLRPFEIAWVPAPLLGEAVPHRWEVISVGGSGDAGAVRAAFEGGAGDPALAIYVSPERDIDQAKALLEAIRRATDPAIRRLAVLHHGTAGGITRTLALERPDLPVRLIDVSLADGLASLARIRREAETGTDFEEARLIGEEKRLVSRLRPSTAAGNAGQDRLGPDDVLLVSGGGKGIGAESAIGLAAATGARVAVLGRSSPEDDEELSGTLRRLREAGVEARYVRADVCDAAQVRDAVDEVRRTLGPVTALVHSAGFNRPRLIGDLDGEDLAATLRPKVPGLRNLLDALDRDRLRVLVAFGSVIARSGLRGEADYALANDWMRAEVDAVSELLPNCRCVTVEWSVWSGAGMGDRLNLVESLTRMGIMPISPDDGVDLLRRLVNGAGPATSVVASGRLGDPPTLRYDSRELPLLRFLDRVPVHYPDVEMVAEATLSTGTDMYLADHALDGVPLVPAVVGLEAMAQVCAALTGSRPERFEQVELPRPITVPEDGQRRIRIAALLHDESRVEVVVRSEETGFEADHFRAVCRLDRCPEGRQAPGSGSPAVTGGGAASGAERELYERLLFHGPAFQRVREYRGLHARSCSATVETRVEARWFSDYLPHDLVLGDFGARDAFIHAAQACIPHKRVLPVSVHRIHLGEIPTGEVTISAVERESNEDGLVYDLLVLDAEGRVCESWEGLVLHVVAALPEPGSWSAALLVPYLERRAAELIQGRILAGLAGENDGDRAARTQAAIQRALGREVRVEHRPDGRTHIASGEPVSASHSRPYTLGVAGEGTVACDVEAVEPRMPEQWRGMLGEPGMKLAELLAAEHGEELSPAATRVWSAAECVRKAGGPTGDPLVLDRAHRTGWTALRSGRLRVAVSVLSVDGAADPIAVAALTEEVT
ncbi:SDR family NAD(P)-dependent oxidoreductase [Actinomadura sp. 3N407]|uniref:SDR family NAD(P)-dependent oxidoreductase n=1 Tax=Actinomadura sp. 3N407 TaxID=3457423 RepID=UPI003FCE901F